MTTPHLHDHTGPATPPGEEMPFTDPICALVTPDGPARMRDGYRIDSGHVRKVFATHSARI